uniref:Smp_205050 n=1 Tax=Schistosoma mansoni TaxID=6183 RepID=A0A3Q0KK71_SCHMA
MYTYIYTYLIHIRHSSKQQQQQQQQINLHFNYTLTQIYKHPRNTEYNHTQYTTLHLRHNLKNKQTQIHIHTQVLRAHYQNTITVRNYSILNNQFIQSLNHSFIKV